MDMIIMIAQKLHNKDISIDKYDIIYLSILIFYLKSIKNIYLYIDFYKEMIYNEIDQIDFKYEKSLIIC